LWQFVFGGGFEFAEIFTKLGRDEVELQPGVDFFFAASGDGLFVLEGGEAVLA